jgi:hypothetical protein
MRASAMDACELARIAGSYMLVQRLPGGLPCESGDQTGPAIHISCVSLAPDLYLKANQINGA